MKTLTNRQLIEEFNKFLRENECASKFYVNRIKHLKNRVGIFLTETQPLNWTSTAFSWKNTPQGHNYWSEITRRWRNYIREEDIHLKEIGHKS